MCSYQAFAVIRQLGQVWLTRPSYMAPAYLFTLVRFSNNTSLILTPEADQHRSRISSLATSKIFTQRRIWTIGAGSLHANGMGYYLMIYASQSPILKGVLFTLSKVISIMCEIGSCCETSPEAQHSSNSGWYTRTLRPWIVYEPVGREVVRVTFWWI